MISKLPFLRNVAKHWVPNKPTLAISTLANVWPNVVNGGGNVGQCCTTGRTPPNIGPTLANVAIIGPHDLRFANAGITSQAYFLRNQDIGPMLCPVRPMLANVAALRGPIAYWHRSAPLWIVINRCIGHAFVLIQRVLSLVVAPPPLWSGVLTKHWPNIGQCWQHWAPLYKESA